MPPISRILVPVDFSERCLGILPQAKAIACEYNAALTLLHVVNPVHTIPAAGPFGPVLFAISPSVLTDAVKHLDAFGEEQLEGIPARRLVYEGDPVDQIVAFAQSDDTQLIVMPTHGFGALRRFLIGSVSAKVLHDVDCPVLTGVHTEHGADAGPVQYANVLCAVDLGPESRQTLAWASDFAKQFHARLEIVHALTTSSPGSERDELQKLQQDAGVEADTVCIMEGDADKTVCSVAASIRADLLVIGRGSREDAGGRLRSNAYAIIRQSPCPVVSV